MSFARLNSSVATPRGFAFAVVKPALKHGSTLDCRYRGRSGNTFNHEDGCDRVNSASDDHSSALADYEPSPAIDRRVSVENKRLVA